jgi:acyl-CoA thioesterase FadM
MVLAFRSKSNYIVRQRTNSRTAVNLYLRLLWTLLRSRRLAPIAPGAAIERRLRVWPGDLDINGHMNNGRYLTIIDLMLVEYFVRSGFARAMFAAGWRPMSGGAVITYRKALKPWQRYRLRFALEGADAAWNYMRFEFLREDGLLCAAGYMKGAAVGASGLVPNAQSYARMGHAFTPQVLPAAVRHWLAAENAVIAERTGS